ncbi:MAG: glycosyltransferase [Scytonema sp. PMC 1069.18]|nr:glycosyltransferase [Scytonema sp. PMC 1069.18]MEC4884076.1 glycosyltransferase [Scytonema sp. PMC 1070.18]
MAHYGLICPAASGHLNPMTTLGYELQKRGHRVTLFGILDAQPKALAAGLEFQVVGESDFPLGAMKEIFTQLGKLSGLAALRYTVNSIKQTTQVNLRDLPTLVKLAGVEALIVDQVSPEGGSIAELVGIPFISCACALMINRDISVPPFNSSWSYSPAQWAKLRNWVGYKLLNQVGKPIREVLSEYRHQWNLPPHSSPNDSYSQLAQLSQQPAEFEFPRQNLPDCFHFTGAYNNPATREPTPFPFEKLTGQPLIYASMGTIQNRLLKIFHCFAEACSELDVQLVISLGGSASPEVLQGLPGQPLVVGYAPQIELLEKTALTITHAGMNTTLESLTKGVPMVAIPIANDQPGVASRIVWSGCGEAINLKKLNVSGLRTAIQKVLTEENYQKNALRLQNAIKRAGGVSRAADIVEQVVSTGKPI